MRTLYYANQHEELVDIIKDYGTRAVDLTFYLGDTEFPLQSGDYRVGGDSAAWNLGATIVGRLSSKRWANAPGRLTASFEGIEVPVLLGTTSLPIPKDDDSYATDIILATPGSKLGRSLKTRVQYQGNTPEQLLWDALTRVFDYDASQISIPSFGAPIFTLLGQDSFADTDSPQSIIDEVNDKVAIQVWDRSWNLGVRVIKDPGTGEGLPLAWEYDAEGKEVSSFPEPQFATPDDQFTSVVVRALLENGAYRLYEEVAVPYRDLDYPPTSENPQILDWTGVTADQDAYQLAVDTALSLSRGQWTGQADVYYNPLLEPGDVVTFAKSAEDDEGRWLRVWRGVLTDITHPFDQSFIYTTLGFTAVLLSEERMPDPMVVLPGVTPGVVFLIEAPFGTARDGFWFDPDGMSAEQTFIGRTPGRGMWVDTALAGEFLGHTGHGFWFDIRVPAPSTSRPYGSDSIAGFWVDPENETNDYIGSEPGRGLWIDEKKADEYLGHTPGRGFWFEMA